MKSLLLPSLAAASDQISFAFEVVRHGARTPLMESECSGFTVARYNLTPEGMRQRYLLGRNTRQKYKGTLLSTTFVEGEVLMESTDVDRTLQSAFSELMGLYPPGSDGLWQMNTGELFGLFDGRSRPRIVS